MISTEQWARVKLYLPWVLLLALSVWPLFVASHCWRNLNDDSYITLTYAKSLAHGQGFVFNHPPATLGTTTPLFTLAAAFLGMLMPNADLSLLAVFLTAFCWIGIAWVVYGFRHELGISEWSAVLIGAVVLVGGWLRLGSEAYLFQFLFFLIAGLFYRREWVKAGICCGLLFLTRGEGLLVLPLCFFLRAWEEYRKKDRNWRAVGMTWIELTGGFAIPFLMWSAYAFKTFGHILPDTLSAKIAQGRTHQIEMFHECILRWCSFFWDRPELPFLRWIYWVLAGVGLIYMIRSHPRWLFFVLWIAGYIGGYSILRVGAYYWYQYPVYMVWMVLVAFGVLGIIHGLGRITGSFRWMQWICAGLLIAMVLGFQLHYKSVKQYEGDERALLYTSLCQWLNLNTQPTESVAYAEVGYLGYFSRNKIVDLLGLTMPDIQPFLKQGDYLSGFWKHEPDYYVDRNYPWFRPLLEDPKFKESYTCVVILSSPKFPDKLRIYKRMKEKTN